MTTLPCTVGPAAQAIAFRGTGKALTAFTTAYDNHKKLIPLNHMHMYNKVWWRVFIIHLLTLPIGVIMFVWGTFYFLVDELSTINSLILGIGQLFCHHYLYIFPASSGEMKLVRVSLGKFSSYCKKKYGEENIPTFQLTLSFLLEN